MYPCLPRLPGFLVMTIPLPVAGIAAVALHLLGGDLAASVTGFFAVIGVGWIVIGAVYMKGDLRAAWLAAVGAGVLLLSPMAPLIVQG